MKYGPCRYTGFIKPGQIPNFCSIRKHVVIISPHAYKLLGTDYRHTETSVSGGYLTHILVNLKSESKQKHHQKFVGGILILHKNELSHNHKLAQAIIEQCEFDELSHPVCGIDQTSSKHCLIRHLKNHTGWTRYKPEFESSTPKSVVLGYPIRRPLSTNSELAEQLVYVYS